MVPGRDRVHACPLQVSSPLCPHPLCAIPATDTPCTAFCLTALDVTAGADIGFGAMRCGATVGSETVKQIPRKSREWIPDRHRPPFSRRVLSPGLTWLIAALACGTTASVLRSGSPASAG
eukprot:2738723-Rhodomonas_salina.7